MLFKEMLEKEYIEKDFDSPVGVVHISKERNIYNALKKKYLSLGKQAIDNFTEKYKQYKDYKDMWQNTNRDFQESIAVCIEEMSQDLISMERYDLDKNAIFQRADEGGALNPFYDNYYAIIERLSDIQDGLEAARNYREIRKKYSSDKIMASVQNFAGNQMSKVSANADSRGVFEDPNTLNSLLMGIAGVSFCLHKELISLLTESGVTVQWDYPDSESATTATRLLNNLKSGAVPKEKEAELYLQIFDLNPYDGAFFECIFDNYGDKDGSLGKLAEHFGIELLNYKDKCALQYVKDNQGTTEEDAVKAKEQLLQYCEEITLPVADDLQCMQYINKLLYDFDLAYRTVDGVVCETRDGADFAREEFEKIKEFMQPITPPTSESLLDYEENLLAQKKVFEETFQSELREKYLEILNQYLNDFDAKFCKYGLLKSGDRKQAGKERLYNLVKKQPATTPAEIDAAYEYMKSLLPKVGLEEREAEKTLQYLNNCKGDIIYNTVKRTYSTEAEAVEANAAMLSLCTQMGLQANDSLRCVQYMNKVLADFDCQYRTVEGIVCSTREAADYARGELPKITEFMTTITAPTAESLLDYEADLLAKRKQFEDSFHTEIIGKYLNQFDNLLADFDKKFCSTGFMKKVDRKQAGRDRALKFVKKLNCATAEETLQQLDAFLPKVGLSREEAQEATQFIEKKFQAKGSGLGRLFKK